MLLLQNHIETFVFVLILAPILTLSYSDFCWRYPEIPKVCKSLPSQNHHNYSSHVSDLASTSELKAVLEDLSMSGADKTKICLIIADHDPAQIQYFETIAQILNAVTESLSLSREVICIVENASPECIDSLGSVWNIEPGFFFQHAKNPRREDLWISRKFEPNNNQEKFSYIDGNFEYHGLKVDGDEELNSLPNHFERHCYKPTWEGVETITSNTRISYYRVKRSFCKGFHVSLIPLLSRATTDLFLVDAPLDIQKRYRDMSRHLRLSLRLPYAENRGGLELQPLFELRDKEGLYYSLYESFKSVFVHGWQRDFLFAYANGPNVEGPASVVLPPSPLCYILSNSIAKTNLRYLSQEIMRISFQDIKDPDFKINDILHDRREDLVAFFKKSLIETISYVPEGVDNFVKDIQDFGWPDQNWTGGVIASHRRTLKEATELEKFLMETFQLLLSSISINDAKMSVRQGQLSNQQSLRATQLTILASIYAPLSFVVGIYGMNLEQINGSGHSIWVFFVTLVVAGIVTVVIYLGFELRSRKISIEENAAKVERSDEADRKSGTPKRRKRVLTNNSTVEMSMA